jgi:YD repeat-containing protein
MRGSVVSTLTGAYTHTRPDVTIGPDDAILFLRTYNSNDPRVTPLGPNWTHSYHIRLTRPTDGSNDLVLTGPQGRTDRHVARADGTFAPRPDVDITLAGEWDGTYVATHGDGTVWHFSAGGQLFGVRDRRGRQTQLTYDASGRLVAISDPHRRGFLSLEYEGDRLVAVLDWLAPRRSVRYAYDERGRLSAVTDRAGHTTRYAYAAHPDGDRLATIVDARGHTAAALSYDAEGRVSVRRDARGQERTMAYAVGRDGARATTHTYPPSGFAPGFRAAVTDSYDADDRLVRRVTRSAPDDEPIVEEWTYDGPRQRRKMTTGGATTRPPGAPSGQRPPAGAGPPDPAGVLRRNVAIAARDAAAVERDEVDRPVVLAAATGRALFDDPTVGRWRVGYDAEDRPTAIEALDGHHEVWRYRYDAVGNLVEAAGPTETSRYAYDEGDRLVECASEAGVVRYGYDDRGNVARVVASPPGRDGPDQVVEYAYEGLGRLRRVSEYAQWPDRRGPARVTELAYDADGRATAFGLP